MLRDAKEKKMYQLWGYCNMDLQWYLGGGKLAFLVKTLVTPSAAGGMPPASLGKPNSPTLDWLDQSLARSNTVGHARKRKPTGNLKLCFMSLQGPSTTLLLHVNIRGDGLYSSPQAKQWVLVSDCADQTILSQINKSYYKISH